MLRLLFPKQKARERRKCRLAVARVAEKLVFTAAKTLVSFLLQGLLILSVVTYIMSENVTLSKDVSLSVMLRVYIIAAGCNWHVSRKYFPVQLRPDLYLVVTVRECPIGLDVSVTSIEKRLCASSSFDMGVMS